jgi:hypothetical protein
MSLIEFPPRVGGQTHARSFESVDGWAYRWDSAGWGEAVPAQTHVFATREVRAVAGADAFGKSDRRELIEALRDSAQSMLSAAGASARGSALELRYVAEPVKGSPTKVRLFVTSKGILSAAESSAASVQARVNAACSQLPKGYEWGEPEPVNLWFPPDSGLVEVRKQEELIEPTMLDVPTSYYYVAHPVEGDGRGWENFGHILADVTEPVMVSILFSPARLDENEGFAINTIVTMLEYYGNPRQEPDVRGMMESIPPDGGAAAALPIWREYLSSLRHCFLARATVAGPRETALAVARALAAAAGLADEESHSVRPVVQQPRDDASRRCALHSFGLLDVVPWGGNAFWTRRDAPSTMRRLPYLYSLKEAATLAVLPVPDSYGAPGFQT